MQRSLKEASTAFSFHKDTQRYFLSFCLVLANINKQLTTTMLNYLDIHLEPCCLQINDQWQIYLFLFVYYCIYELLSIIVFISYCVFLLDKRHSNCKSLKKYCANVPTDSSRTAYNEYNAAAVHPTT